MREIDIKDKILTSFYEVDIKEFKSYEILARAREKEKILQSKFSGILNREYETVMEIYVDYFAERSLEMVEYVLDLIKKINKLVS